MAGTELDRMQRHLDEDHAFRRAQSARTVGLYRSAAAVADAAARTSRPPRTTSPQFRRLGVRWVARKGAVLAALDASPDLAEEVRGAWRASLASVTLTGSDEALTDVLDAARVRAVTVALTGTPGAWRRLNALVQDLSALAETHTAARAAFG